MKNAYMRIRLELVISVSSADFFVLFCMQHLLYSVVKSERNTRTYLLLFLLGEILPITKQK